MDILYYWKDYEKDIKAGRIGRLRSRAEKLKQLASGSPDYVWVVRTPPGRKGQVQLLGRLRYVDAATAPFVPDPGYQYIHYDPNDPESVLFTGTQVSDAIDEVTAWVGKHFPGMRSMNFQGTAGQEAVRGAPLTELRALAARFKKAAFSSTAAT